MTTPRILLAVACALFNACQSPIKNSYALRKQAAGAIGKANALPTVWNIAAPLELGRVYQRSGNAQAGYFLSPGSEAFVDRTKELSLSQPNHTAWSESRSGSWNAKAQLTYMGLQGEVDLKNVRAVTFSLDGDTYAFVRDQDAFEALLNLPTYGPALRQHVIEDAARLEAAGLPSTEARYWIVVQLLTAKDLAVTFHNITTTAASAEVVDPAKVAGWLSIENLSPASLSAGNDQTRDAKLTSPDVAGLVAQCVPLRAYTSGPNRGQIYPDLSVVLTAANGLK